MLNKEELEKLRRLKIAEYFRKKYDVESINDIEKTDENRYRVVVEEDIEFTVIFSSSVLDEIFMVGRDVEGVEMYEVEYIPDDLHLKDLEDRK